MMYSFITSGLESEIFISNNLQDDANAAGQGPHFENCCGCEVTGMKLIRKKREVMVILERQGACALCCFGCRSPYDNY